MASASDIAPSENKAYYLRWMCLIFDGGTLVLKDQFDQRIPPCNLDSELKKSANRKEITTLISRGVITKQQEKLLYPLVGKPDSSTFDVSLLTCLLRNLPICGLNKSAKVWKGVPPSIDVSTEADIVRLRLLRNEISHQTCLTMTETHFLSKWKDIEQVLYRLGSNIPDLHKNMNDLKLKSIDPKCEQDYEEKLKVWEETDKALQSEMKTKLREHDEKLSSIETEIVDMKDEFQNQIIDSESIKEVLDTHKENISNIDSKSKSNHELLQQLDRKSEIQESQTTILYQRVKGAETKQDELGNNLSTHVEETEHRFVSFEEETANMKRMVTALQAKQENIGVDVNEVKKNQQETMSSELRSLSSISKSYFQKTMSNVYVKTKAYEEGKAKLLDKNVLIISGHPGEGKTAMANKLVSEISSPEKCLKLRTPSDWKHVDLELDLFNCVLIDDVFGAGVLDENLLKKWEKYFPDLAMAVQNKPLYVIITTRHYILEDAKQKIERLTLFKTENVQLLSSQNLSSSERAAILKIHMERKERQIIPGLIELCINFSESFLELLLLKERGNFLFGFPECVRMFVNNDELYKRGPLFFNEPNEFFRKCIEELYKNEEKFLALVMLWSCKEKALRKLDLDLSSTSHHVQTVAKTFGFKPKAKLIKVLRKSLEHHKGGFVDFDTNTGVYTFNHNVIDDMVGLVLSKDYPNETLRFCSRDFVMEYVTTDRTKEDEYHLYIDRHMYENLHSKLLDLLYISKENPIMNSTISRKMSGHSPKTITLSLEIDAGVLFHNVFTDSSYVKAFVQYLKKYNRLEKALEQHVLTISGYFMSYGICLEKEIEILLPAYSLYTGNGTLYMEMMQNKRNKTERDILHLMIAVHEGLQDVVQFLLLSGTEVNEDVIFIAAQNENIEILTTLLQNRKSDTILDSHIVNGNNALIASAKNGFTKSVLCLVEHDFDINCRNNDGMSALHKAILYKHEDICQILIEKGSQLDYKAGKYKRTPLHMASDMGQVHIVTKLLERGASNKIKDYRGHYALHCAAVREHTDVVKVLLKYDIKLANLKISSYGSKSLIKGMTVFHIAVWKNNSEMIDTLLELNVDPNVVDLYGRTPFYCAVYDGKTDAVMKLINVCDVSIAEKQGFTPLHAALHKGHSHFVSLLCPRVDVNVRDKFGRTALHVACEKGNTEIAKLLVSEFNADMRIVTKRRNTIFHILKYKIVEEYNRTNFDSLVYTLFELSGHPQKEYDARWQECFKALLQLDTQFGTTFIMNNV